MFFGTWATGIFPGEDPNRYWGPAPLEAWVMSGVAVHRVRGDHAGGRPGPMALKQMLGFSKVVIDTPLPSTAIVDMATQAEGKAGTSPPLTPSLATADGS